MVVCNGRECQMCLLLLLIPYVKDVDEIGLI